MPTSHQKQRWSPERLINWGSSIGPGTRTVVECELNSKPHKEHAYRSCLGLLNLQRSYGDARLEQACQSAILLERPSRRTVNNLLKNNLENQVATQPSAQETAAEPHSNIRGAGYFN